MDWISIALGSAVLIGIAAGVAMIIRSPTFWYGLGVVVLKALLPHIWKFIATPEKPEDREARLKAVRSGQEWDPIRKRPRDR